MLTKGCQFVNVPVNVSSKYTKSGTLKFSNLEILKFYGTILDINTTLRQKLKDGIKKKNPNVKIKK